MRLARVPPRGSGPVPTQARRTARINRSTLPLNGYAGGEDIEEPVGAGGEEQGVEARVRTHAEAGGGRGADAGGLHVEAVLGLVVDVRAYDLDGAPEADASTARAPACREGDDQALEMHP